VFTVDEEEGLTGAGKLQGGLLDGDILFNLDSEDEGELCIGCAGGMDVVARLKYREEAPPAASVAFKVGVSGLKGGHSGVDIQLGRANANKIMTRLLWEAGREMALRIGGWEGGDLRNAIPRWAGATVTVPADKADAFEKKIALVGAAVRAEFAAVDPDIHISVEKAGIPTRVMNEDSGRCLLNMLYATPHGAFAMIHDMPEVTETSTNLAIVKAEAGVAAVTNLLRSSVETKKTDVENILRSVFEAAGAEVSAGGGYPAWQPNTKSPVLRMLREIYEEKYGKAPRVTATHGGLECGIICAKYPGMDAVSLGPTIKDPHSPDESVDIASVARFWNYMSEVLRRIPAR
jgi:dipeptidase D